MAKPVEIACEIDIDGNLRVDAVGTQGPECMKLLECIDKIGSFLLVETVKTEDFKDKKVQRTNQGRTTA